MRSVRLFRFLVLLAALGLGSLALAQSFMTGSLSGKVESENAGLPGVAVTIKSPTLQGTRTVTTSTNGDFVFVGIPPGSYTVTFVLQGFQTVTKTVNVTAGQAATVVAAMALSSVQASATVTAKAETVSTTTQASTTYTADLTNKLPITRTLLSAAELSAGITRTGPNQGVVVSGASSFDNLFAVDGAVVNDNIRGTPNNLFVEDAIQETTTSVNSISAEFGRFQGGVINSITKSGGNTFSGSFRTTLTNDAWTGETRFNEARVQKVNPRYEATLGGPFWKDHIWFFGSYRYANITGSGTTSFTVIPYETGDLEKRYQGKLTLTPIQNHTVTGNYLKVDRDQTGNIFGVIMDTDSLVNRSLPQEIITINYNGTLTSNLFLEGLYSRRKFTFENSGSVYTDLIKGTLMRDLSRGNARYNSPTFCGVCGPEERNNRDYLIKGTYFLSTPSLGSHNIVLGYDNFAGTRKANNYQSGSNYRVFTTSTILTPAGCGGTSGIPCQDIFPVIDQKSYVYYTPIALLSHGTDALTHSVFLNDQWRLTERLSFNLGVRWDKNHAGNSLGAVTADDSAFSPRLAGAYDVTGKGNLKVAASYAKYVGGIQDSQLDGSSAGGQPATFQWDSTGTSIPIINSPPGSTLVSRADALQMVFNWFFAQGCPDLSTCKLQLSYASVPGLNRVIRDSLKSPYANEYVAGVNGTVFDNLAYRLDLVRRDYGDFYDLVINQQTGTVKDVTGKPYDLGVITNSNGFTRNYTGLQTQFQWRGLKNRLLVTGNWTWSHLIGDAETENPGSGPLQASSSAILANTLIDTYPEYKDRAWYSPKGDLLADQRHRVRLIASYDLPIIPEKWGNLNISAVQAYQTGIPYAAAGNIVIRPYVPNTQGYASRPASVLYYFTSRDTFRTDSIKQTDLALNFSFKIAGQVEVFVQPQITNLFDNAGVVPVNPVSGNPGVSTAIQTASNNNRLSPFNPFTDTPTRFVTGAEPGVIVNSATGCPTANSAGPASAANYCLPLNTFGRPQSSNDIQVPRTFLVTMGLRF